MFYIRYYFFGQFPLSSDLGCLYLVSPPYVLSFPRSIRRRWQIQHPKRRVFSNLRLKILSISLTTGLCFLNNNVLILHDIQGIQEQFMKYRFWACCGKIWLQKSDKEAGNFKNKTEDNKKILTNTADVKNYIAFEYITVSNF